MLVLVKDIDRICELDNAYHIVVELKLLNCKELEKQAKQIDKENYSKECFVAEFNYDKKSNKLYWLYNGICYIDNNGNHNEIQSTNIILNNIYRTVCLLVSQFLKNKEQYIKENNIDFEKI